MMRNIFLLTIACALMAICSLSSCDSSNNTTSAVDDAHIQIAYKPLYKELAAIDTNNIPAGLNNLKSTYGDFLDFFLKQVAGLQIDSAYTDESVQIFFKYPDFRNLLDTVVMAYPSTDAIQKDLNQLFARISSTHTKVQIPEQVVFYTAMLHEPAFTLDSTYLGIGLDQFLGPDFWPYSSPEVGIPQFISRFSVAENIPIVAATVLYNNYYETNHEEKSLLELMLMEGKKMYFLSQVLPNIPEDRLFGYTKEQLKWAEDNELYIYDYFAGQQLLYEKSPIKILRYIAPAPTSMGMPAESPGKTGTFIGYKIIQAYQKRTGMTLAEVLSSDEDAQTILTKSKYKPKK